MDSMGEYYYSPSHYPLPSQSQSQFYPPFQHSPSLFHPHSTTDDDFIVDPPQLPPIQPQQQQPPQQQHQLDHESSAAISSRICSLKGCGIILADDYTFKMCESCRVKHQGYSRIKRNKRRQEKIDAGISLRNRGPNKPKPQLYRVNGQLSVDPKWEYLDRRLFPPRPATPPTPSNLSNPPNALPPMQKDGYRRKPLPPKDDGAIELNFVPVKICSIKGCYQPIPAEYEKKTCLECQERYKGYAVTKRAKRRALKRLAIDGGHASPTDLAGNPAVKEPRSGLGDDMSGMEDDFDGEVSGPDDDGLDADIGMALAGEIPIDPTINPLNTNFSGKDPGSLPPLDTNTLDHTLDQAQRILSPLSNSTPTTIAPSLVASRPLHGPELKQSNPSETLQSPHDLVPLFTNPVALSATSLVSPNDGSTSTPTHLVTPNADLDNTTSNHSSLSVVSTCEHLPPPAF